MSCVLFAVSTTYVSEVVEILRRLGRPIDALVVNVDWGIVPEGVGPVVKVTDIRRQWLDLPVVVPLTTPGHRKSAVAHARALGFHRFPVIVDPTAIVAGTATLEEGTVVNAGAIVGARTRLGPFVSVNRGVSLGHDGVVEEYASLGPSCVLGGQVRVRAGAFVGLGAVVLPEVTVGKNAVVGGGAVVIADVPERGVVVGNPARVLADRAGGYGGVSV